MIIKGFSNAVSKWNRNAAQALTVRKFAEGMGIAAAIGLATGFLISHKAGKKTHDALEGKTGNAVITIEVQGLETMRIEKIE